MTSMTPRPMGTPDLAGILSRPKRPARSVAQPDLVASPASSTGSELDVTESPTTDSPVSDTLPTRRPTRRSRPAIAQGAASRSAVPGESTADSGEAGSVRSYLRPMTVYLPRSIFERLDAETSRRGISRTAMMLMAVNDTHERLPELLAVEPAPRGALFDVPQARPAKTEPDVQTSIRVTDQQLAVLQALATQNSTNRSRVLTAAIDLFLG